METYGYIGLIDNKVKTLIQLPWVPIYTNTEHLIEVETNNKMKTLIPQSQRLCKRFDSKYLWQLSYSF